MDIFVQINRGSKLGCRKGSILGCDFHPRTEPALIFRPEKDIAYFDKTSLAYRNLSFNSLG